MGKLFKINPGDVAEKKCGGRIHAKVTDGAGGETMAIVIESADRRYVMKLSDAEVRKLKRVLETYN